MPLTEEELTKERGYFVVKDNRLITKTRYSLSLQQQRILAYFISRIKPEDEPGEMYNLSIKEFSKVCGYVEDSGYYYQSIKADIKKLRDVSSWIELEDGKEVLFAWIDRAEIDKKHGIISVSFHKTVAPYLFELKEKYTLYSLANVLYLSHKYSIRLYEFLYSNRYRNTFEISVEELKKHIDAENYTVFGNFHSRILKPAITEINDYTDLIIEYGFRKTGKAITHIIFKYREMTGVDYSIKARLREKRIEPERRKQSKEMKKEIDNRRKSAKESAIEAEGTITAQMTLDDLLERLNQEEGN